jgi:type I restriction enzyme, S subunit
MSIKKLPFLEVFNDASGGNIKTPQKEFLPIGEIPVVDQGQKLVAGYINDQSRICKAQPPVIVFGDHTRVLKYIDFAFAMGADGTKILVPKVESHVKYLFYALQTVNIPSAGYSRHYKFLKETEIPLPPLAEQKRIAKILNASDALRAKRRETLAQLDTLLQSTFLDMFGDPVTNPKGWGKSTLEKFSVKVTDGDHHTPKRTDFGIKLLSARNVLDGEIDLANTDFVSQSEYDRMIKRCHPEKGDVLISCSGSIGRVSRIRFDEPIVLVRSAALVKIDHCKAMPEFVEHLLRTPALKAAMLRSAKSSSQANLFQKPIKNLPVFAPPLGLQSRFATIVKSAEQQKAAQHSHLADLDTLFTSLQQRAFNGEL